MMTEEHRILTGLLWIASMPNGEEPSPFERSESIVRGVGSMRRAGVPEAMIADAYRADLQSTVALEAIMRWANWQRPRAKWEAVDSDTRCHRSHGVLVLRGPKGTGKTAAVGKLLALRIETAWRALDNGGTEAERALSRCEWVDCRGLISTDWDKVNALDDLVDCPCLVLDDLSAAVVNREGARVAFMALLGQRHEKRLLTIITSNLSETALETVAEPAVWSRVSQDGEIVDCPGEDLRATVETAELDAAVGEADRLAQLVRRLAPRTGYISDEIAQLPRGEAVRQLGRLLGCSFHEALEAAAAVDAHDARCDVLRRELAVKIAGSIRLVAANDGPDAAENAPSFALSAQKEAKRAASKARAIELLEQGDDESPAEVAERKRIAANLEREAKRR
jgi:hypothetical protein